MQKKCAASTARKATKKRAPKKPVEIVLLIDMSGSMLTAKTDVVGGFNSFLEDQKKIKAPASITAIFFNSGAYEAWLRGVDLACCPEMALADFRPAGMTPLIDSAYRAITEDVKGDGKVIFVIITDGAENYSQTHTLDSLRSLIAEKTKAGWTFEFLGAGFDAFHEADSLGICNTTSFHGPRFMINTLAAASDVVSCNRLSASAKSKGAPK